MQRRRFLTLAGMVAAIPMLGKTAGNTLVVFTSDNGPWLSHGENGGHALPLHNGKGSTFDGGMRVRCIM